MKHQEYRPIACGLHEQYQLAAIRRALLDIRWDSESGETVQRRLRVLDVFTRDRAEFLSGETLAGEHLQIRLDRIHRAAWAQNGETLEG